MKSTRRIRPAKKTDVPVVVDSKYVHENLPLPFVHYPELYGTFIGFSESEDDQVVFCHCSKGAIENYLVLHHHNIHEVKSLRDALYSNQFFPDIISKQSIESTGEGFSISFKEKICHRCNMSTPSVRYCHEMYGGNFKQYFGWYIKQTSFRLGISGFQYLSNVTPESLIEEIQERNELLNKRNNLVEHVDAMQSRIPDEVFELDKIISKFSRKISKQIENITRQEFGFRKVGEGNVSEAILTNIIRNIFPNEEILTHHRPKWLAGLELDIFLPGINIGVEYQGQQHFHPVKAWGGMKALLALQERDKKKRELCKKYKIELIEVDYTEPLELKYIKKKICA